MASIAFGGEIEPETRTVSKSKEPEIEENTSVESITESKASKKSKDEEEEPEEEEEEEEIPETTFSTQKEFLEEGPKWLFTNGSPTSSIAIIKTPNVKFNDKVLEDNMSWLKHCDYDGQQFIVKLDNLSKDNAAINLRNSMKTHFASSETGCKPLIRYGNMHQFLQPDSCAWTAARKPTQAEKNNNLTNSLRHPDVWIEIAYNNTNDREKAKTKIQNTLIPTWGAAMHIVLILLPGTWASFPNNPGVAASTPLALLNAAPATPYIMYWPVNTAFNAPMYYRMAWNKHVVVGGWQLECNDVLSEFQ